MTSNPSRASDLLVVLDPEFGERLRDSWHGQPIWITMSTANAPVVRAIWSEQPNTDPLTCITGFIHRDSLSPERQFLYELDTIDLHHGPYSTDTPYTVLTVIGVTATSEICDALAQLGFSEFRELTSGFIAHRSEHEAKLMRG